MHVECYWEMAAVAADVQLCQSYARSVAVYCDTSQRWKVLVSHRTFLKRLYANNSDLGSDLELFGIKVELCSQTENLFTYRLGVIWAK